MKGRVFRAKAVVSGPPETAKHLCRLTSASIGQGNLEAENPAINDGCEKFSERVKAA
jgi:hypothetical protein